MAPHFLFVFKMVSDLEMVVGRVPIYLFIYLFFNKWRVGPDLSKGNIVNVYDCAIQGLVYRKK